jgi:hypothetical protein
MSFQDIDIFWSSFIGLDKQGFETVCRYAFNTFGTTLSCNRFDIGNCVEFALADMLSLNSGFIVTKLPNDKRYDMHINGHGSLSVKYSSSGDIRLHNSLGNNKDMSMKDTIFITPKKIYMLTETVLKEKGIILANYLQNTGDALVLKRTIFRQLADVKYPYILEIDIVVDKKECENKQCSEIIFQHCKEQVTKHATAGVNENAIDNLSNLMKGVNISC